MKKRIVRGPQVVILKKPPPAPLASFLANPTLLPKKPPANFIPVGEEVGEGCPGCATCAPERY